MLGFLQKPHIPVWADSEFLMMAEDVGDFVQLFDWSALNSRIRYTGDLFVIRVAAPMTALKYLQAYPAALQDQVRQLIADDRLGEYLSKRYPQKHGVQSDKALYTYALDLKQEYLRNAPAIDKVLFDNRLDLTHRALGLHTTISRVQGGKLKAKKEIRVASLFKEAPCEFLKMIVVHELAHFKESDHNKAFYKLCEHMLPGYHQVEFDLRVYLTWRDMQ